MKSVLKIVSTSLPVSLRTLMPCGVPSPPSSGQRQLPLRSENEINQKESHAPFLKDGNKTLPNERGDFAPKTKHIPVFLLADSQYVPPAKILLQSMT